jgi:CheY-like chemotaxis protein
MVKSSPPHILVVEDDAKVRLLLRRCFEGEGFRVSEAGSGTEAMERLVAAHSTSSRSISSCPTETGSRSAGRSACDRLFPS